MKHLWAPGACLLVVALIAAPSALAQPFHRGDVFLGGPRGIEEYSPDGTPVQLIEGTSGGNGFCFDPYGNYLIEPGVGLFDRQGRLLASNWASIGHGGHCEVNGSGDVFVGNRVSSHTTPTLTTYDIEGNAIQSLNVAIRGLGFAIALAPDGCTIYYGSWGVDPIGRINVCTDTQEAGVIRDALVDELRVLPNSDVLASTDGAATLFSATGSVLRGYISPARTNRSRYVSLDPDGTSFWMCCDPPPVRNIPGPLMRFDINTGKLLSYWTPIDGDGPVAVYSPDNNGRGAG